MLTADPMLTRRRVLLSTPQLPLVLAALTVSACTNDPPAPPPPDPDREALESARIVEDGLRATVLAWAAEPVSGSPAPESTALQATALAVVDGHLSALDAALGSAQTPSPSASPAPSVSSTDLPASTTTLVTSLDAAVDEHTGALRSASPAISPLLASIAASDAALGAAVRRSSR